MSANGFQFSPGTRIRWQETLYEVRRVVDSKVNLEELSTEMLTTVELKVLTQALFNGQLEFDTTVGANAPSNSKPNPCPSEGDQGDHVVQTGSPTIRRTAGRSLDDYPPEGVAIAHRRYWVIEPLLDVPSKERTFATILSRICEVREIMKDQARTEWDAQNHNESERKEGISYPSPTDGTEHPTMASNLVAPQEPQPRRTPIVPPAVNPERRARTYVARAPERKLQSSLSVTTIYRWMNAYLSAGRDLRALIPSTHKRGGKNKSRLPPQVNNVVEATIRDMLLRRERVTTDVVMNEVALRIHEANEFAPASEKLLTPSRRTVARRVSTFTTGESAALYYAAKHGSRAARQHYAQYGETKYPSMPLERVEIDHTRTDLMVVDENDNLPLGRLTLTYAHDIATRYPLGFYLGFEPPSYLAVLECLYHAICPKTGVKERYNLEHEWLAYGVMQSLVVDNGREFVGRDLKDACQELGIELVHTPVRTPHFKAGIERHFGTLNTTLWHQLPGTTFSNPSKRGDYNSVKQACIGLDDVDKILHIWSVDLYAEHFHTGLGGVPARRWEGALGSGFVPRLPRSLDFLKVALGRVEYRVLSANGIEFESLRYNSSHLALLRTRSNGEKVKFKYHPSDMSRIYVHDPFEAEYIEVPALAQEYTQDLSLWKHRVVKRFALDNEEKADLAALGRAKRRIREIVQEARARGRNQSKRRTSTGNNISRWQTGGKPVGALDIERTAVEASNSTQREVGMLNKSQLPELLTEKPVATDDYAVAGSLQLPAQPDVTQIAGDTTWSDENSGIPDGWGIVPNALKREVPKEAVRRYGTDG